MTLLDSLSHKAQHELREELRKLIHDAINDALAHHHGAPAKRWLTANETATYLGCSVRAVYRRIERGRIPTDAVKHHGRRLEIDRLALDRALERD